MSRHPGIPGREESIWLCPGAGGQDDSAPDREGRKGKGLNARLQVLTGACRSCQPGRNQKFGGSCCQ